MAVPLTCEVLPPTVAVEGFPECAFSVAPTVKSLNSTPFHPLNSVPPPITIDCRSADLDGLLARRWNQRTPLGAILDPLADKLVLTASLVILTFPDWAGTVREAPYHIPVWVTVPVLGKDILILLGVVIMHFITNRTDYLHARSWGKATTAATFLLVLLTLLAPDLEQLAGAATWLVDLLFGLGGLAVTLALVASLDYIRLGSKTLAKQSGGEKV